MSTVHIAMEIFKYKKNVYDCRCPSLLPFLQISPFRKARPILGSTKKLKNTHKSKLAVAGQTALRTTGIAYLRAR